MCVANFETYSVEVEDGTCTIRQALGTTQEFVMPMSVETAIRLFRSMSKQHGLEKVRAEWRRLDREDRRAFRATFTDPSIA